MGHISRWVRWSAAGIATLLFIPIVSMASDAYSRYEAKINNVCDGKILPPGRLFSTSPYDVKGKCYAFNPTGVSQLVSRHAEMVQGNAIMLIFNRQEKYPNIPYGVVVGVGAFRYTDAGGAIRVVPEVRYVSAYVESPAIIKLQAEANAEELAKQAKQAQQAKQEKQEKQAKQYLQDMQTQQYLQAIQTMQAKQENQAMQEKKLAKQIEHRVRQYLPPVFAPNLYCQVTIELSPQGQLEEAEIDPYQSSGSTRFNLAVLAALKAAAPFPPPIWLSGLEFTVMVSPG